MGAVSRPAPPERDSGWRRPLVDVYDEVSARAVADDMVAQLAARGWPVLDRLLDRTAFMDQLATGELGDFRRTSLDVLFARAEALLLMESGPSEQLERALHAALEGVIPEQEEAARAFDSWVREHAAKAGAAAADA